MMDSGVLAQAWLPPRLFLNVHRSRFEALGPSHAAQPRAAPASSDILSVSSFNALDLADVPDAELPSGEIERSSESSTSRFSGSVKRLVGTSASALREYSDERWLGHLWRTHADSTSGLRANRPPCAAALHLGSP